MLLGYYSPLLILQAFCVYHAYKNNAEQRWYWLIMFLPGIGCAIYLYQNFYSSKNIQNLEQGLKQVVNSNYKIEQLEKSLRFVDNYANKINLADAYMDHGRFKDAVDLYQSCLNSFMADDVDLQMKLLKAHFYNHDFVAAIQLGQKLEKEKNFKNAEARVYYAWAHFYNTNISTAEDIFTDLNKSFTNYRHRLEYCRFLKEVKKHKELTELVKTLLEEFEHMKGPERKLHRSIVNDVKDIARTPA